MASSIPLPIDGMYYSGETSRGIAAALAVSTVAGVATARVIAHDSAAQVPLYVAPLAALTIPSRIGNTQRRLLLDDGATFTTRDNDAVDALGMTPRAGLLIHRLESSAGLALVAVIVTAIALSILLTVGVPIAATRIAEQLPMAVQNRLSIGALEQLDALYLEPTKLPDAERDRVIALASEAIEHAGIFDYNVQLRSGIGPNALTLPDGTIVITDSLVSLLECDDELLAVIYHELGHLENRHLLRRVLQSSFVALGFILLTGDVTTVETLVALPTVYISLGYSRDFEIEADRYALDKLVQQGIGVEAFTSVMTKLGDAAGIEDTLLKYLSTHPMTSERLQLAEEYR